MLEHQAAANREEQTPQFRFKVVKRCKTALQRQVREAVRIKIRGNVLNKNGMFKLTRMVVDTEWDQKVWEEAWEPQDEPTVPEGARKSREREQRWRIDMGRRGARGGQCQE